MRPARPAPSPPRAARSISGDLPAASPPRPSWPRVAGDSGPDPPAHRASHSARLRTRAPGDPNLNLSPGPCPQALRTYIYATPSPAPGTCSPASDFTVLTWKMGFKINRSYCPRWVIGGLRRSATQNAPQCQAHSKGTQHGFIRQTRMCLRPRVSNAESRGHRPS